MKGIDLDKPITFLYASLRFFSENEYHLTRFCKEDVLIMVFEGTLCFTEDNVPYEVHAGEYHMQKKNTFQTAEKASDSPKYLYVHFLAEWADHDKTLPFEGTFDYSKTRPIMEELDKLSHNSSLLVQKSAEFFKLLTMIKKQETPTSLAYKIEEFICSEELSEISLDKICQKFHFSKNHVINIFKKELGITPAKYINDLKLEKAKYLMEVTSDTIENISFESGFNDYSNFYKIFLSQNGLSPSEWRNKKRSEPVKH